MELSEEEKAKLAQQYDKLAKKVNDFTWRGKSVDANPCRWRWKKPTSR